MAGDQVLAALERALRTTPRTGTLTALVRVGAIGGDVSVAEAMAEHIADALRSHDVVEGLGDGVAVLLRGVQDLPNAVEVAHRVCAVAQRIGPACAGVTVLNTGEAIASVSLRAQGALDLARDAGPGAVVSSPPLPA